MAKSPKQQQEPEDEAVIMGRMEQALRRGLSTPHVNNEELVRRRRGASKPKRAHKDQTIIYKSDCAVHDAPAYEAGALWCGV